MPLGGYWSHILACFGAGSEFAYTGHGFTLLSAVLEGATGREFTALLREFFLEAGMKDTHVDDPAAIIPSRAR